MLVLAAVPDVQFHKLRRTAGGRFSVVQTATWDDVLPVIRGRPVELAGALAPLPSELRWVLEEALRAPGQVQTVSQVAVRARVDRRTCERWFTRVGLPSPRHFLSAARVLYAHRLLQDPGFTIEDVAKRLGYAQTKTLQLNARAYLGLTAGEMRLSLSPEDALARVVQQFLTPAGARVSV